MGYNDTVVCPIMNLYHFTKKPRIPWVQREHFQSNRDKAYNLFLHYSTVRLAILAFVIPVAFRMITADHETIRGCFLIVASIILNWIFAANALRQALIYASLKKFLRQNRGLWLEQSEYEKDFKLEEGLLAVLGESRHSRQQCGQLFPGG